MQELVVENGVLLGWLVIIGGIFGPLFWSLHMATKPVPAGKDGWIITQRSIFDHVIGCLQFGLALVLLFFGIVSPIFLDLEGLLTSGWFVVLMLIMAILFLRIFFFDYFARIKFNSNELHYKALWRSLQLAWNGVEKISIGMNGPKIHTVEGSFSISNTRRGFYQLLEMAKENGVSIQDSPYLKQPGTFKLFGKRKK